MKITIEKKAANSKGQVSPKLQTGTYSCRKRDLLRFKYQPDVQAVL
jgi:hypothetical protein